MPPNYTIPIETTAITHRHPHRNHTHRHGRHKTHIHQSSFGCKHGYTRQQSPDLNRNNMHCHTRIHTYSQHHKHSRRQQDMGCHTRGRSQKITIIIQMMLVILIMGIPFLTIRMTMPIINTIMSRIEITVL